MDVRELIPSPVIARNGINDEAIYMTVSEQAPQST